MLDKVHEMAINTLKGVNNEIDLPMVVDNLRWVISNLASQSRDSVEPLDKEQYLTQIEVVADCISWIVKIHDTATCIETYDNLKGGDNA